MRFWDGTQGAECQPRPYGNPASAYARGVDSQAANKPEELQTGVGTGPYKVASADRGTGTYKLVVNENCWDAKPNVTEVNVRFVSEESSRVVALRSGEVEVIDSITPDSVAQLKSVDGIKIESVTGTRYNQLFYNFRKPAGSPMSDPKVREGALVRVRQQGRGGRNPGRYRDLRDSWWGYFRSWSSGPGIRTGNHALGGLFSLSPGGSSSMTSVIKSRRRRSLAAGET